ncbi:MAG: pectin methylesterase-like acyl-CoA thioesterase, partial [Planctomycetota bacterium]
MSRTCAYLTLAFSLLSIPAFGQFQASRVGPQGPFSPAPRTDRVLVVDPAGAGDYLTIQAAVDAAPEGALVLVKPGTYA